MKPLIAGCILSLILCLFVFPSYAQTTGQQSAPQQASTNSNSSQAVESNILKDVTRRFVSQAQQWQQVLFSAASYIFWTLATISVVWTGVTLMLRRADSGEFVAELFKFSMFLGFFLWLFTNGPTYAFSIIESLTMIGAKASGTNAASPDIFVKVAFNIFGNTFSNFSVTDPVKSLALVLVSAVVLLLLLDTAITFVLIQISGVLSVYAGIFILGFGGSRWTSDMAINYYKTILGTAVQLMVAILLISIGINLLGAYRAQLSQGNLTYEDITVLLIVAFVLRAIVVKVPPMVAGMITSATGGSQVSAGSAAGVAAAAAAFGGGALAAAKQATGGGSAVIAAVKSAMAAEAASGGSVLASMRAASDLADAPPRRSSTTATASGRSSSASDAASKPTPDFAGEKSSARPAAAAANEGASSSAQSTATTGAQDAQGASQGSESPNAPNESTFGSPPAANASIAARDASPSSSGDAPSPSTASSSSPANSQDVGEGSSSSVAQSLASPSTDGTKPWEVADGKVPQEDIARTSASLETASSKPASSASTQDGSESPARIPSAAPSSAAATAAAPSSSGRMRVAMKAVSNIASGAKAAMMEDIYKNTAGGRIAAHIKGRDAEIQRRKDEAAVRAKENLNIIASAGPEFHAEAQELLEMVDRKQG